MTEVGFNMGKNYIETAEAALLHTYNRYQIVLEKGEGVYLYDTNGKEYLDFAAGIAVCSLGYGHPKYKAALKAQIDQLMHTSNLFYSKPVAEAAQKLKEASQMDRVFFTNSGTEAIEGALKAARKYAYTNQSGKYEFTVPADVITLGSGKAFEGVTVEYTVKGTEPTLTTDESFTVLYATLLGPPTVISPNLTVSRRKTTSAPVSIRRLVSVSFEE